MKQLFAILLTAFSLAVFAADAPATDKPTTTDSGMKLAKKKDHSKDKKVDATKSPKSSDTKKAEAPKK